MLFRVLSGISILSSFSSLAVVQNYTELSVKPSICVVSEKQPSCAVNIKITWQAVTPQTRCLYQAVQQEKCWRAQKQVDETFALNIDESKKFMLKDENNDVLIMKQVTVNSVNPKKYRRRLRADWSLF